MYKIIIEDKFDCIIKIYIECNSNRYRIYVYPPNWFERFFLRWDYSKKLSYYVNKAKKLRDKLNNKILIKERALLEIQQALEKLKSDV